MKINLTILIIITLFINTSCSYKHISIQNETTHKEATVEFLLLMDIDNFSTRTIDKLLDLQIQQNPSLADYKVTIKEFFNKYMSWEALKDEYVKIYIGEFSENEIRNMIKFYKTETGKKAISKFPILLQKGAELGQKRVQDNMVELQNMLTKRNEELINSVNK